MVSSEYWFGAEAGFYNSVATQSLRFDIGSSTYLTRTPSSEGDRRTWTASFWVKRSDFNTSQSQNIFTSGVVNSTDLALFFDTNTTFGFYSREGGYVTTNRVFRDPSAWYHIVVVLDTTQGTASNRVKIYVNGTQETSLANSTYPDQNSQKSTNDDVLHRIGGRDYSSAYNYLGGYLAEFNLIDGTALDPTYFGETKNGVWIPIKYTGSYGTNGFRLQFNQTGTGTASTSTIGADTSGNNNHFTSSGIVASDCNMPDSPENNFSTWNALFRGGESSSSIATSPTLSDGNLQVSLGQNAYIGNTFRPISGKWYCEFRVKTVGSTNGEIDWGWLQATTYAGTTGHGGQANKWGAYYHAYSTDHIQLYDETSQLGSNINLTISAGDVLQLAWDIDNNKGWVGINDTWYRTNASDGNPSSGTNETFTFTDDEAQNLQCYIANGTGTDVHVANFGQDSTFGGDETATSNADANGIGAFHHAPPSGFLALCTSNLPEPTISPNSSNGTADEYFNTVLYTGNGTGQTISGVGFQPDWTWNKNRQTFDYHILQDSSRGAGKELFSNSTDDEETYSTSITSWNTDGFVLGSREPINANGETYVSWNWKANGTTPTKTYKVKVVADSTDYGHGSGANKYQFFKSDGTTGFGTNGVDIDLQEGGTYVFDWSDSSAQGHPLRFSLTNNGTHGGGSEYTTGVVKDDSAYKTTITVASGVANLYYYCQLHSGMGAEVRTNTTHGSTNFDGSILSVSNVNTTSGFSINTYTGNASAGATVGHGLGAVPKWYIVKSRSLTTAWVVYHEDANSSPQNGYMQLDISDPFFDTLTWNDTAPTSTVFSLGGSGYSSNNASATYVAYCFTDVEGYSKFGSFIGNGSTDGVFVFTGFRPAWLMLKRTTDTGSWNIADSVRSPENEVDEQVQADLPNSESTIFDFDFLSNGFKARTTDGARNGDGSTYIYMAFAEAPFKYANAR